MTPDEIRDFLAMEYPDLIAEPRSNPDGWAFFAGPPRRGPGSNRILRAARSSRHATTRLKLAVSSRLGKEGVFDFTGDGEDLRELVAEELRLYLERSISPFNRLADSQSTTLTIAQKLDAITSDPDVRRTMFSIFAESLRYIRSRKPEWSLVHFKGKHCACSLGGLSF